ncbi:MAG TPA: T9SS type A sorting domain-containing protein [Candidatus Saccharimonadaceae bacterium]|nr:T9SS type A sorting domain-containing protein [Candidatus Saccharimonadaceae bacterium]
MTLSSFSRRLLAAAFPISFALLLATFGPSALSADMRLPAPNRAQDFDYSGVIDVNDISMFVTNTGCLANNRPIGTAGLEFPKGSGKTAVYTAGLWLAARVDGQTRVAVSEYSDEFAPGAMPFGLPDNPANPAYRVYSLLRVYSDAATRDAALADYDAGAVPYGAPPVVVLGDGSLSITGDQMLWAVFNDGDPTFHTNNAGQTAQLGVEVQETVFAFNHPGALAQTVFVRWHIFNRGSSTLDSMYVGLWSDPDLGDYVDDLIGCDTTRSLGYAYNGDDDDAVYGSAPPAIGFELLRGAQPPSGPPLPMTAFTRYVNGTDPATASQTENYIRGLNQDGTPIINPTDGLPTRFMVSGAPEAGTGWLDTNPSDRRMLVSSGPVTLAPGGEQDVLSAIFMAQGFNRISSTVHLRCEADGLRDFVNRGMTAPDPAAGCEVIVATLASLVSADATPERVALEWYGATLASRMVSIERRTPSGAWTEVAARAVSGTGSVTYEDLDVTPGARYGYRLAIADRGATAYAGEAWVDVPSGLGLALDAPSPNPMERSGLVAFSLPSDAPAELSVWDAAGRRVWSSAVGDLGAGRHVMRLDERAISRAGVYVIRLSQSGHSVMRKAVLVR